MEISREHIFDFLVVLNESEFAKIKCAADDNDISLSEAFKSIVEAGIERFISN